MWQEIRSSKSLALIRSVSIVKKVTTFTMDERSVLLFAALDEISDKDREYMEELCNGVTKMQEESFEGKWKLERRFKSSLNEAIYELIESPETKNHSQNVKPILYIKLYGHYQNAKIRLA